jgi:alkanesulfonate monooxygenase SsuD/methylene tetrahydromethanopterin reductase-like flavin-dependent oxidoreductase (luciferase family)
VYRTGAAGHDGDRRDVQAARAIGEGRDHLDDVSNGRALFGVGAGYEADEAAAMGLLMPALSERFDRLEETVRIALQMWAEDESSFEGARYTLDTPVRTHASARTWSPK